MKTKNDKKEVFSISSKTIFYNCPFKKQHSVSLLIYKKGIHRNFRSIVIRKGPDISSGPY